MALPGWQGLLALKYVWNDKKQKFVAASRRVYDGHYVQPDIAEHGGKAKWREHLKRTGTVEMGHTELRERQEKWQSRQSDFKATLNRAEKLGVRTAEAPEGEIREAEPSRLNNEMRNRLDGRPMPERKMLLKLTLETQRMLNRRR